MAFDQLMVRHWDSWQTAYRSHLHVATLSKGLVKDATNLMSEWNTDIAGMNEVRREMESEVLPYLGGLDWMSEAEFHACGRVMEAAGVKKIVIDTLSMAPGSPVETVRVQMFRDVYGIEQVGSEFPQKFPSNADFGFAIDQPNNPDTGRAQGASFAELRASSSAC